jgi:hypothetical protein
MLKTISCLFVGLLLLAGMCHSAFGQAPGTTPKAVTVSDVIAMLDAKVPDSVIVARVQGNQTTREVSTDDLVQLKKAGASEAVMLALMGPSNAPPKNAGEVPNAVNDPDVLGVPFAIESQNGRLLELERQNVNTGLKVKAFGLGGGRTVVRFEGKRSSVRFQTASQMRFVLRTGLALADISSLVNVDRLTSTGDQREVTIAKVGPMGLGAKSTSGATDVVLKATPCGRSSICFTAATPLMPGEYVITLKDSRYGFLFGVD